jgi:capsular exopolysaccharide synthesis family protein
MLKEEKQLRAAAEDLGTGSFELEAKRAEIEQSEAVLKSLRAELDRIQIDVQSSKRRISSVHQADVPRVRSHKERTLATVFAGGGLFLCGTLFVSYRELRARKIHQTDEFARDLALKVLGTLPALPGSILDAPADADAEDGYWVRMLAESVSYIRTRVLAHEHGKARQVFLIASAEAQEGKTMLAGHLAVSIAQSGRRTLLIDGDLRRPSIATLFDVPAAPGVGDVLSGTADVQAAIFPTVVDNLFVLPAGECSLGVIHKLGHAAVEALFRELRAEFDYIIVDSSPMTVVADSLQLSKHADGVVLCVRQHVSRSTAVLSACERLHALHRPLLGIVVNGVQVDKRSDAYRYLLSVKK